MLGIHPNKEAAMYDFSIKLLTIAPTIYFIAYVLRYLLLSFSGLGLTFLVSQQRKIQPEKSVEKDQILREMRHSIVGAIPISIILTLVITMGALELNAIYFDLATFGWPWFFGQVLVLMVLTDIWFYFVHRIMHSKKVFKLTHKRHHLSTDPSPFASNSVHPIEAFLDIGFLVLASFIIPLHPIAIFIVISLSAIWSAYGHLGYEIAPRFITKTWWGKYINYSTVHNQHHATFKYNFGYYTTVWDRLFGTLHPDADRLVQEKSSAPY